MLRLPWNPPEGIRRSVVVDRIICVTPAFLDNYGGLVQETMILGFFRDRCRFGVYLCWDKEEP